MTHRKPFSFSHGSETTHWDHPELVNTFKSLIQFNTIRSSKLFQYEKYVNKFPRSVNV